MTPEELIAAKDAKIAHLQKCLDIAARDLSEYVAGEGEVQEYERRLREKDAEIGRLNGEQQPLRLFQEQAWMAICDCNGRVRGLRSDASAKGHHCEYRNVCDSLFDVTSKWMKSKEPFPNAYGEVHRQNLALEAKLQLATDALDVVSDVVPRVTHAFEHPTETRHIWLHDFIIETKGQIEGRDATADAAELEKALAGIREGV